MENGKQKLGMCSTDNYEEHAELDKTYRTNAPNDTTKKTQKQLNKKLKSTLLKR